MRDRAPIRRRNSFRQIGMDFLGPAIRMAHANKIVPRAAKQHFRHRRDFSGHICCRCTGRFGIHSGNGEADSPCGARSSADCGSGLLPHRNRSNQQEAQRKNYLGNCHGASLTSANFSLAKNQSFVEEFDLDPHFACVSASVSGSSCASRQLAVEQTCAPVSPSTPCKSAPSNFAPSSNASRITVPVNTAPRKSAPRKSAPRKIVPFICAPESVAPPSFAPEKSANSRLESDSVAPCICVSRTSARVKSARSHFVFCRFAP